MFGPLGDLMQKKSFYECLPYSHYKESSQQYKDLFNIHFVYQSNLIEGIVYYPLGETVTEEEWETRQKDDWRGIPVWHDHKKALDYVLENFENKEISREEILRVHSILTERLLFKEYVGHYRKKEVNLINSITNEVIRRCPPSESLSWLIKCYDNDNKKLAAHDKVSREEILENHAYFEWIHPFADGNGRTGRLIMLWNSLRYRDELLLIPDSKRQEYYTFLKGLEGKFNKRHQRLMLKA